MTNSNTGLCHAKRNSLSPMPTRQELLSALAEILALYDATEDFLHRSSPEDRQKAANAAALLARARTANKPKAAGILRNT